MGTRLKLDLGLAARFISSVLIACAVLAPMAAMAVQSDLPDPEADNIPLVEIEYGPAALLPYKERRSDWGYLFGMAYENYDPTGYQSDIDSTTYETLFGTNTVPMFGLQGGAKYNLDFASLTAELSYEMGSVSDSRSGDPTTLKLSKVGTHFGLWLDMLFTEPYVVPYAQMDVYQIDYEEKATNVSESGTSGILMGWTAGALVQLNWLDPDASLRALSESGLDNAYVNIFMTQSQANSRPDLATAMTWGAGLKLEF
ncbi:MAG: hypothetical protein KF681_12105 [Bdellovibrionaceae bacterium]|nr:hypothetical protein [Pseudobdellovibrionaceae bacterium]